MIVHVYEPLTKMSFSKWLESINPTSAHEYNSYLSTM